MNSLLLLVVASLLVMEATARDLKSRTFSSGAIVSTVKHPNGDIIDCVDINKQPALAHPLLKNHKIQRPHRYPDGEKIPQIAGQESEFSCPKGTIPILRTPTLDASTMNATTNKESPHQEWSMAINHNGSYLGAAAEILGWDAHAEPSEYSLNFVGCGNREGDKMTSMLIAGWAVYPGLFNDTKSRTFIALSINNSPLCFNQNCRGFVQVSQKQYPGQAIYPPSVFGDANKQYAFSVDVYKDPSLLKWWVAMKGEPIGYFPLEVIPFINFDSCFWGGSALNHGNQPSRTEMGNGHFTNEGATRTGMIVNARVKKSGESGDSIEKPSEYLITRPLCYDFKVYSSGDDYFPGYSFLYGGPGAWSVTCR